MLTELRLWQNNVQTRHVSDVHVIVHMRLQHGPLRARRLPRLCRTGTRYIGPQHDPGAMVASVRDACFESISRPANARRELQPVRPTAPPLDTAENACQSRDGRDNHGERKSIHAGGCTRLRKQWPERGPHAKKVSSGPHAGEGFVRTPRWIGFVRTPCWRGFRQDPMHIPSVAP